MELAKSSEPNSDGISSITAFPKFEIHHVADEEIRVKQAHLAHFLRYRPARGLSWRQSRAEDDVDFSKFFSFSPSLVDPKKLQMHEEPLRLTDAMMFLPNGATSSCTLEAHVNGFRITGGSEFQVDLMFANVRESLVQLGVIWEHPPALLFCLRRPVMLLGEKTEDIQVFLLSADLEKGGRTCRRDEELVNFARKVQENHRTCGTRYAIHFQALENYPVIRALEKCETGSVSSHLSVTYVLTTSAIVVIRKEPPFFVIQLRDVEIVNLTHLQSDEIDMTIVFEDFTLGLYQISSIPSIFLTDIKRHLDFGAVKFYVNKRKVNWHVLMRDIAKYPEKFRKMGGWESLDLEDDLTLACYPAADSVYERGSAGFLASHG